MKQVLFVACALLSGCALAAGVDMGELVREAKPAILQLYPLDSSGASMGQATGFFMTSDGFALTNYHVIERAATVIARSLSGARYQSEGRFMRLSDLDVAIVHFKAKNTPHIFHPGPGEIFEGEHVAWLMKSQQQGLKEGYQREFSGTTQNKARASC